MVLMMMSVPGQVAELRGVYPVLEPMCEECGINGAGLWLGLIMLWVECPADAMHTREGMIPLNALEKILLHQANALSPESLCKSSGQHFQHNWSSSSWP